MVVVVIVWVDEGAWRVRVHRVYVLCEDITVRSIRLGQEPRRVWHVQYTGWPDRARGGMAGVVKIVRLLDLLAREDGCLQAGVDDDDVDGGGDRLEKHMRELVSDDAYSDTVDPASLSAGHSEAPPVVVHCSAGCGRTGTLIAIDMLWRRDRPPGAAGSSESSDHDEVYSIVSWLREQRVNMVQSLEQFAFCYEALLRVRNKS